MIDQLLRKLSVKPLSVHEAEREAEALKDSPHLTESEISRIMSAVSMTENRRQQQARQRARRISSSKRAHSTDDTTGSASACPSNAKDGDSRTRRLAEEVGEVRECSAKRENLNP